MKKILVIVSIFVLFGGAAYSFINSGVEINNQRGCCSHHGGVASCGSNGYFICADGLQSPTCRCK